MNKTSLFAFYDSVVIRDRKLLNVAIEDKTRLVVGNKVSNISGGFLRVLVIQRKLRRLEVLSMNLCHEVAPMTLFKIASKSFAVGRAGEREKNIYAE
jgi:hypothetical protein